MANYVLVHGAWHGGWCYRDTAAALRKAGHTVHTPTHTGLGQRAHLASDSITLETHIRDVAGCIESEELQDVILVGHSYGGMVITGVADRLAARIKSLVYLDAFVPEHQDSLIGLLNKALVPEVAAQFIGAFRGAALDKHSGMMQPIPAEVFNIAPQNRAWVDRRCVPQALATFEMPLLLTGGGAAVKKRLYILADGWDPSPFRYFARLYDGKPMERGQVFVQPRRDGRHAGPLGGDAGHACVTARKTPSPAGRGAEAGFREAQASRRRSDARLPARGSVGEGAENTRMQRPPQAAPTLGTEIPDP